MAQCKLTPREFISNTFSPQIGAVCSPAAEAVSQRNNLSFIELLQPFSNLTSEGYFKDPQGTTIVVRNLHLSIQDIYSQPPEPSVARKLLNDSVSIEQCERTTRIRIGSTDVDIPISVPWFEAWREMFLNVQFPSDHEFTKHFIACMVVVSTTDENPLEKIQQMAAQLSQTMPGKLPKWFNNNALRYYILLHDSNQHDKTKAESVFTEMKNLYGANNCFLLAINSRSPDLGEDSVHLPDPWSRFLTRQSDFLSSDTNSSPRTPADTGGVSSMPNQVSSEPERSSQAGTPSAPQNPILLSPDATDKISLTSELADVPNTNVEVGQEAVSVTIHPLSPISQEQKQFVLEGNKEPPENSKSVTTTTTTTTIQNHGSPINVNVWEDSPTKPTPHHGARLSTQDLDRIRTLITEFCIKSLLPYVERQIGILNDLISNKKGVSRSLFSATKRWFGTSKPGAPSSAPTNAVIYTVESPELQLRRLGDLCFMFGHFSLAYQAYHSAKRDFAADQAWLYYAGALEMAGLASFMQGEMARKTIEYMDDAILTYSNTCKMAQFAVRATLLSSECLKGRGLYGEAAKQLIRMTSEDSDLRSALLLEQAAYCFISPKMIHKYAFHAVLAGHRFSKAVQRKHSLRCYQQAYQVYQGKGWALAEDHIHYSIGRQAASLKKISEAVDAFQKLLNPFSKQPLAQQAAFLREFLQIQNLVTQDSISKDLVELPVLPLPLVDGNQVEVLCGPIPENLSSLHFSSDEENTTMWSQLEEVLITEAQGSAPMIFKPTVVVYSNKSNNTSGPVAIVDEPIHLSVEFFNPLKILLPLTKVKIIWEFKKDGETFFNETETENSLSESSSLVDVVIKDSISLQPNSRQRVILSCTPTQIGELKILGISYNLLNPSSENFEQGNPHGNLMVRGKKLFQVRGPKLKNVKEKPDAVLYGVDKRLDIKVVDKYPFLDVSFSKMSPEMLCGEIQKLDVTVKNTGSAVLTNLLIGSVNPELLCLGNDSVVRKNSKTTLVTRIAGGEALNVGEKLEMPLWIRAPHKKGNHQLDLLFYYENVEKNSTPKYRLRRHSWMLTVLDAVQIKAIVRQSVAFNVDSPTLNLVLEVKNSNQVHDPFMNEIILTKVSLKSQNWQLKEKIGSPANSQIQPQETCHLLLKMEKRKSIDDESHKFSDISLVEDDKESILSIPYANFVEKCNISKNEDNQILGFQGGSGKTNENSEKLVIDTMMIDMTVILRWRAKVMEGKVVVRHAIGQHQMDLEISNKMYKHPEEVKPEQSEYPTTLKIFGPDRNVPDSNTVIKKETIDEKELRKSVVTFSLEHGRNIVHGFRKQMLCIIPITLHMRNHSKSEVQVKVNTIGTSSQTFLPSIKTQLYSPKASTSFRHVGHTTILSEIEPYGSKSVNMKVVVTNPGTYDFASRIDISAKITGTDDLIPQEWRIESVCTVSDENL